jgi:hypothetical protein
MADWAPNRNADHLFAVLRLDPPHDGDWERVRTNPSQFATLKEELPTMEEAEREVERLTGTRGSFRLRLLHTGSAGLPGRARNRE